MRRRYRPAALFAAALGVGGFRRASTNFSLASPRRLIISWSLMIFAAACWVLTTTKSVTDVPRSSAARSMIRFCSRVIRASRRSNFAGRFRALRTCCGAMVTSHLIVRRSAVHVNRLGNITCFLGTACTTFTQTAYLSACDRLRPRRLISPTEDFHRLIDTARRTSRRQIALLLRLGSRRGLTTAIAQKAGTLRGTCPCPRKFFSKSTSNKTNRCPR